MSFYMPLQSRKVIFMKSLDSESSPSTHACTHTHTYIFSCYRLSHTTRINWEQVSRSENFSCVGKEEGMHIRVNARKMKLFHQLEFCFFKVVPADLTFWSSYISMIDVHYYTRLKSCLRPYLSMILNRFQNISL